MLNKDVEGIAPAVSNAIYTPAEVAAYTKEYIKGLADKKDRAVSLPIPGIKDYFAPIMAGQVTSVIAQTSQFKSGFLHFWERQLAMELIKQGREDEAIVHVSVEETAEEQGILSTSIESGEDSGEISRGNIQDWSKINQAMMRVGTIPIYRIGDSIARAEDMQELYLTNIIRSISYLQSKDKDPNKRLFKDRPLKIAALFIDYLQALPVDPEHKMLGSDQRRLQVRSDVYRLRQMSALFNCPVIVAVQAKQELNHATDSWRMPEYYDGEESAAIAQRSDRIICLWMPKMTHPAGSTLKYKDVSFTVTDNLLFVKVAKQRGRLPSGRVWKCFINFENNNVAPEANFE